MSEYVLGIDIGGTFTDVVLVESATGIVFDAIKVFTTSSEPERAAQFGMNWAVERLPAGASCVVHHGTTLVTNMLLEGHWSEVGMITTVGFRDVIELHRQVRHDPHNLFFLRPTPLVPRHRRRTVSERMGADGSVVIPLDEDELLDVASVLVEEFGVEAIVVCFLNSHVNQLHELRALELIGQRWPNLPVVGSAVLLPRRGEFERFSTACVNAATLPKFSTYLGRLDTMVTGTMPSGRLLVMQGTGKLITASQAAARSVDFCESGPAAGVVGAITLANGADGANLNLLMFDVGGTTAKVAAAWQGHAGITTSYSLGGSIHGRTLGVASSGYKVAVPMLDLVEIGSGGGSVVWIDSGGALRVGPESVGAEPGPICYGRGGLRPSLCDALVVAGVLSEYRLLGGELELQGDAAREAFAVLGEELAIGAIGMAVGAINVAVAAMTGAMRAVTFERGHDPSDFALLAFGGNGPVFAALLAEEMGVSSIRIPQRAGVFSAWGLALGPIGIARTKSLQTPRDRAGWDKLNDEIISLRATVLDELESLAVGRLEDADLRTVIEVRYPGQSSELEIDVTDVAIGAEDFPVWLGEAFEAQHETRYGFRHTDSQPVIVGVRVEASLKSTFEASQPTAATQVPVESKRVVHLLEGAPTVPVYRLDAEGSLDGIEGPLIVDRYDTTVLVPQGWTVTTDVNFIRLTRTGGW